MTSSLILEIISGMILASFSLIDSSMLLIEVSKLGAYSAGS